MKFSEQIYICLAVVFVATLVQSDPCTSMTCGVNAECKVVNDSAICECSQGYTGDPITGCTNQSNPDDTFSDHGVDNLTFEEMMAFMKMINDKVRSLNWADFLSDNEVPILTLDEMMLSKMEDLLSGNEVPIWNPDETMLSKMEDLLSGNEVPIWNPDETMLSKMKELLSGNEVPIWNPDETMLSKIIDSASGYGGGAMGRDWSLPLPLMLSPYDGGNVLDPEKLEWPMVDLPSAYGEPILPFARRIDLAGF